MPVWWLRKSKKQQKEEDQPSEQQQNSPGNQNSLFKYPFKKDKKKDISSEESDDVSEACLPKQGRLWLGSRSVSAYTVSSNYRSSEDHGQLRANREFGTGKQSKSMRVSPSSDFTSFLDSTTSPSKWNKGMLIGAGCSSNVYFGFDSKTGEICAIKEVKLVSNDHASSKFKEIHFLCKLSHPNILRYYTHKMVDNTLLMYLEYVPAGSIHDLLQQYGLLKEPLIKKYTRQIISVLIYLHEKKIVHRNVKCANIFVESNGGVKLANFSVAKHIKDFSSILPFKESSLHWTAPELVMDLNPHILAMDIWSLGCTILEMATSKPPWSQYDEEVAKSIIIEGKEIPEIPSHLSNDAKSFVRLCMQRDPSLRPTASQLQDHPFIRYQTASRTTHTTAFDKTRKMEPNVVLTSSRSLRNPKGWTTAPLL